MKKRKIKNISLSIPLNSIFYSIKAYELYLQALKKEAERIYGKQE